MRKDGKGMKIRRVILLSNGAVLLFTSLAIFCFDSFWRHEADNIMAGNKRIAYEVKKLLSSPDKKQEPHKHKFLSGEMYVP